MGFHVQRPELSVERNSWSWQNEKRCYIVSKRRVHAEFCAEVQSSTSLVTAVRPTEYK